MKKISRYVPEKDKLQALVLYASGLSMNRSALRFGVKSNCRFEEGGNLSIKAMRQN
ncbi:helix-turn-helix domain-containing protein [Holospora elegans]|uniref:helix-turn-helix domain-containing protein n=1 Tax=Holospora elegans TaxID=431043 RepID=UPI001FA6BEED|nr:helix-turn-helix domain-containing protein [Holospora elegans]